MNNLFKSKHSNEIIFSFISFIVGCIMTAIVISYEIVSSDFFNVKITDFIQILVAITVTYLATYSINIESNKDAKKRELILSLFETFQQKSEKYYNEISELLAIIIKTLNITDENFILRQAEYISEKDFLRLHKKLEVIYSGNLPQSTSECIEFTIKEIYPIIN